MGPNRLEGVPIEAENLTKEEYEVALATLSDEMLEVVDVLEKPDMIVESEFGMYNTRSNYIKANLKNEGMSFRHEYGHHVDHALFRPPTRSPESRGTPLWSAQSDKFFRAFEQDRIAAGFLDPNDNLIRRKANGFLDNTLFTPMGTRIFDKEETRYLEDIADALSVGKLASEFWLYGHGKEYFVNRPDLQYTETFANMFVLHGNEEAWGVVEKMIPTTAKVF